MNFTQFITKYLEEQILRSHKDFPLDELPKYYQEPKMYMSIPYHEGLEVTKGKETINYVMMLMAYFIGKTQASYVGVLSLYDMLSVVLNDFDPKYIALHSADSLYKYFKTSYQNYGKDPYWFKPFFWENFASNVISAAKYLNKNFTDFESFKNNFITNYDEALGELLTVRGIGEYVATKFLNYIGVYKNMLLEWDYKDILRTIDNTPKKPLMDILNDRAEKDGVTVYQIYQTLNLIIKQNYYLHRNVKKTGTYYRSPKTHFMDCLKQAINDGTLTL